MLPTRVLAPIALALACACEPATILPDGAVPDGGTSLVIAPTPPAAPRVVSLAPCRTGWRAVDEGGGAIVCEPWESASLPACGEGEAAIPGVGCARIGGECPADGWPADLPATGVVYVRPGEVGGDGTRERPFGTIAETAGIALRSTIALSVGEHEAGFEMHVGLIRGACASGTVLREASTSETSAAIEVLVNGGRIEDLTVVAVSIGIWLGPSALITAARIRVVGASQALRLDSGASFEGDDLSLDAPIGEAALDGSRAVMIRQRSQLTLRRASVRGGRVSILSVDSGTDAHTSSITLEDVAISGTNGVGIAGTFGSLTARGLVVEGVGTAINVDAGATADLEDVVVRDIRATGPVPIGIRVEGSLDAHRIRIADGEGIGLVIAEGTPETHVAITDLVLADVRGIEALSARAGSRVTVAGLRVARVAGTAVLADEPGTELTIEDAWIEDATATADHGEGFAALGGASLVLARAEIHRTARTALVATGAGSRLDASDVTIEGGGAGVSSQCAPDPVSPCPDGPGPEIALHRARISDVTHFGAAAIGALLTLEDVAIEGVSPLRDDDGLGIVAVEARARVTGARVSIVRATRHGVLAMGGDALIELTDLAVLETHASPCADTSCAGNGGGNALACADGARLSLRGLRAEGAANAGLLLVQGCLRSHFERARICGNQFGVVTDATGAADSEFVDAILCDNGADFGTTSLALARPAL